MSRHQPVGGFRAATGLIEIENTANLAGGVCSTPEDLEEIWDGARAHKLPLHLDGARIFNAAVALGVDVKALTRGFDTVMFWLSKGLGAPVGSMLVGSAERMARARVYRKALGGGMRQAGVLAAAGLIALEEGPKRLGDDHANARLLAEALAHTRAVDRPRGSGDKYRHLPADGGRRGGTGGAAESARIWLGAFGPDAIRLVTHRDVSRDDCIDAAEALTEEIETGMKNGQHLVMLAASGFCLTLWVRLTGRNRGRTRTAQAAD